MGIGEIILLVLVGLIILFVFYMLFNNYKMWRKKKKADKDAGKDKQPVADVSPVPIQEQKNEGKVVPIRVNDPIFDKRGYENITERVELKELMDEEHKKENKKIIEKLHNVEIVSEPVDTSNMEGIELKENDKNNEELVEVVDIKNENLNDTQKQSTVDIIKKMVEKDKK